MGLGRKPMDSRALGFQGNWILELSRENVSEEEGSVWLVQVPMGYGLNL